MPDLPSLAAPGLDPPRARFQPARRKSPGRRGEAADPAGAVVDPDGKPISGSDGDAPSLGRDLERAARRDDDRRRGAVRIPGSARRRVLLHHHPQALLRRWIQLATSAATSKITLKPRGSRTWVDVRGDGPAGRSPGAGGEPFDPARRERHGLCFPRHGADAGMDVRPERETGRARSSAAPRRRAPRSSGRASELGPRRSWRNLRVAKGTLGAITPAPGVMTTLEFVADPWTPRNLDGLRSKPRWWPTGRPEAGSPGGR